MVRRSPCPDDISVRVDRGEIVALIGRSGSGKSTVLRVLAGLSTDHTGHREVVGAPALAFQEPRLFPWRDVRTNVTLRPHPQSAAQGSGTGRAPIGRWPTSGSPTAPTYGR